MFCGGESWAGPAGGTVLGRPPAPGHAKASTLGPTQLPPDQAPEVWGAESPLLHAPPSRPSVLFHLSASFWGCWLWGQAGSSALEHFGDILGLLVTGSQSQLT